MEVIKNLYVFTFHMNLWKIAYSLEVNISQAISHFA